jgi:cellobiose phosphorylase
MEIWDFRITNFTEEPVHLSLFSYFEWCLGSSADHHREFHKTFIETEFDAELNALLGRKRLWEIPLSDRGHWNIEYPYTGFIAASEKIAACEGDKESFLGRYGSVHEPAALKTGELSGKTGKWNDSVGVIKLQFTIEADKTYNTAVFLGIHETKKDIAKSIKKFSAGTARIDALTAIAKFWDELLGPLEIQTPDDAMNFLVNQWLRYQAISGRLWGRSAYYQQSGAFGFRDQLQDSLVFLPIAPELTAKQILYHAKHQKEDGSVLHWWHPITETGLETKMTDDLLWLPFIVSYYLQETGDYAFLEKREPYYGAPDSSATIFEHCVAAIEKVYTRFSERGIPLIGAGDWNDGLSAVGLDMKGESVWLAEFYYDVLNRFAAICKRAEKMELSENYSARAAELKKNFNIYSWDGSWYYRGTKDSGEKIGSAENTEGKIFLNPQIWSVISGIGDPDKQGLAMKAVTEHLLKNYGPLLLTPAYSVPDKYIGYLTRYAPGRRENGGVYTHAATWAIWAYAMQNDHSKAYEIYRRLNPILNGMNPESYVCEPYVTPGNIDGPESPNYGMGGWTWYTGSASWFQKMIFDWILGIRATDEGLLVWPCIPEHWKSYSVNRRFRGTDYHIHVHNDSGKYSGVAYLVIDGIRVDSNIIPIQVKANANVDVFLQ